MVGLTLKEVEFFDLYLFDGHGEVKRKVAIDRLPPSFDDELKQIREKCHEAYKKLGLPEFSFHHDNVVYRVTYVTEATGDSVFILRKSTAEIRPIKNLGLPEHCHGFLFSELSTGLVLVSGAMMSGKTSTASSIVKERLEVLGGLAFILEDPPETWLSGVIGQGRCIQVHAGRHNGGYAEQIVLSLRSGANFIMIGEIRDEATAKEVVKASMTGNLVISTLHADKISTTVERLITLAGSHDLVADGLKLVIHQSLRKFGEHQRYRLVANAFLLGQEAKTAIRQGNLVKLDEMAGMQNTHFRQPG